MNQRQQKNIKTGPKKLFWLMLLLSVLFLEKNAFNFLEFEKKKVKMTQKDLRSAYHPDYFSIDNILACQTLIQCRTEMSIPKFGFLVPNCNSEDLPVGIELQLPLWAARVLCRPGRKYVSANIPVGFKDAHRNVIDEEPTSTDLKKIHPQYFEAGHLCTSIFHNDAGELAEMLPEILQQRLLCIGEATIIQPSAPWIQPTSNKLIPSDYLDKLEEKLHDDSNEGTKNVKEWLEPLDRPLDFPITRSQPQQHHYTNAPQQTVNERATVTHNQYATAIASGPTTTTQQIQPPSYPANYQQAPTGQTSHYYHQHLR